MSDIKKIIEEEQRRKQAEIDKDYERFRHSKVFRSDSDNNTKAEKLLSFAPSILRKFAREVGTEFGYAGTDSQYGSCMACYHHYRYEETFWRRKKFKASEIIIGLKGHKSSAGYIACVPLIINHKEYGKQESLDYITEEWFTRLLAKHYA